MPEPRSRSPQPFDDSAADRPLSESPTSGAGEWQDEQVIDIWQQVRKALSAVDGRLACALSSADAPGALVHEALAAIAASPTRMVPITHLADVLGLSASGCAQLVDHLTVTGFVRRHRSGTDRRVVFAALTDDGAAHEQHSTAEYAEQLRIELSVLGTDRLTQLTEIASVLRGWTAVPPVRGAGAGPDGTAPDPVGVTIMGAPATPAPRVPRPGRVSWPMG